MLSLIMSACFFLLMLFLGEVLMFLTSDAYYLLPVYIVMAFFVSVFYRKANCKSLEIKDFFYTLLFVIIDLALFEYFDITFTLSIFWYLFLITFLSFEMYVNSIRFKSLM